MANRYEFAVQAGQEMPVLRFLKLACPTAPGWVIRDAFGQRQVRVNGARADAGQILHTGDSVVIYTSWQREDLPILYEDDQVLLCNKPAGVNSDRNAASPFSVIAWVEERAAGEYIPLLCHRLDNQTSGLIIVAKSLEAWTAVDQAIKSGSVTKRYQTIVVGKPTPASADRTAYLTKDAKHARVSVHADSKPTARFIATSYETLASNDGLSLLSVTLQTGRTHQIRAHLSYLGYPVLGDDLYGDRAENRKRHASRLCLCSCTLAFGRMAPPLAHISGKTYGVEPPFSLEKYTGEGNV